MHRELSVTQRFPSAAFKAATEAQASPVLLVSISVCSGDNKHPNDAVEGGTGQTGEPSEF